MGVVETAGDVFLDGVETRRAQAASPCKLGGFPCGANRHRREIVEMGSDNMVQVLAPIHVFLLDLLRVVDQEPERRRARGYSAQLTVLRRRQSRGELWSGKAQDEDVPSMHGIQCFGQRH